MKCLTTYNRKKNLNAQSMFHDENISFDFFIHTYAFRLPIEKYFSKPYLVHNNGA